MDNSAEADDLDKARIGNLVADVFHDFFEKEKEALPSTRPSTSEENDDCKVALEKIGETQAHIQEAKKKHDERLKKIFDDARAGELLRLKRRTFYDRLDPSTAEKFALLEPNDLLPEDEEKKNDFRINEAIRKRWMEKVSIKSNDSLFKIRQTLMKNVKILEKTLDATESKQTYERSSVHSVESGEKITKIRRSIIKSETQQKTILVADPTVVEIKNFQPGKVYRKSISIMNVSDLVTRYQLEPLSPKSKFGMKLLTRSGDREDLAPGMTLKILISFCSDDSDDSEERIVIRIRDGKDIFVLLKAWRDPPLLKGTSYRLLSYEETTLDDGDEFSSVEVCASCQNSDSDSWNLNRDTSSSFDSESSEIYEVSNSYEPTYDYQSFGQFEFHKCFVGERVIVVTRITNHGGSGRFFTMSEFDWNSMNIDDVTSENLLLLPCFALWPAYFSLKNNEELDFVTYFFPNSRGISLDKVYMLCDNFAVQPIELIGDGVMYDSDLLKIDKSKDNDIYGSRDYQDEEYSFDYRIVLCSEMSIDIIEESITIKNTSGLAMHYRWDKSLIHPTVNGERLKNWKDLHLDFLTVTPRMGIFPPCSSITFKVSVRLAKLTDDPYRALLQLILIDIPLAAIPMDYDHLLENCSQKRRMCESSKNVRDKEIEIWVQAKGLVSSRSSDSRMSSDGNVGNHENPLGSKLALSD